MLEVFCSTSGHQDMTKSTKKPWKIIQTNGTIYRTLRFGYPPKKMACNSGWCTKCQNPKTRLAQFPPGNVLRTSNGLAETGIFFPKYCILSWAVKRCEKARNLNPPKPSIFYQEFVFSLSSAQTMLLIGTAVALSQHHTTSGREIYNLYDLWSQHM